jgi:hypothetical protein
VSKLYRMIVTRDTTESCHISVRATSEEEAKEEALIHSREVVQQWAQDDTPNASKEHYVTDCQEIG